MEQIRISDVPQSLRFELRLTPEGYKFPKLSHYYCTYDPFLLGTADGRIIPFADYERMYLHTIKECWRSSQGGWLDVVLFLYENCLLSYSQAKTIVYSTTTIMLTEGVKIIIWEGSKANAEYNMEKFIQWLHALSDTEYKPAMFNAAWKIFVEGNNLIKNK